ncbi:MAG: dihydrodipicolinate synthase family protein [Acidobacteria bacterium]|nr:dihydrodipicolinate synthase family protein [Acidobacteriota bacterium]
MSLNLQGIIAAMPTPFSEDGEVDRDKLKSNLEYWNRTDLLGYLILGSTGEFPHLTVDEKLAVVETVREGIAPEKLLLVGTGELSTRQTIDMTRRAHDYGADGAVVVTPFYYKKVLHDEEHEAHYLRIADASPIPIMIYLIPQFAGVYLMPETVARLAEHQNIIGLKESSADLAAIRDIFREVKTNDFKIMIGGPSIYTQGLEAGATGAIFAIAALAPNACLEIEHAYRHGNYEFAEKLQTRLTTLAKATTVKGVGHLKAAMDRVGLYGYLPRSPLPVPTTDDLAAIETAFEECGFFEKSEDGQLWIEKQNYYMTEFAD